MPGFQGLLHLARRNGSTGAVSVRQSVATSGTISRIGRDSSRSWEHTPCLDGDPGPVRLFYAVARPKDGADPQVEVMTVAQVNRVRDKVLSQKKNKASSPWVNDYDEIGRKTVWKRLCKWLEYPTN